MEPAVCHCPKGSAWQREARGYAIYRGLVTGLNAAFIIDNETKDRLVEEDPRSAAILKRVLRGKDIQRYQAEWAGMWLIDTHNGYDGVPPVEVDDYPAIKTFLDRHYEKLAKRHDRGRTPYNLRHCAYHAEFSREKLLWIDLTEQGRFAYNGGEVFCVNSAYMLTGESLKYLCAVLNSALVTWFVQNSGLSSGMGTARWMTFTVERIPIPRISETERRPFIDLVDRIIEAKSADADASTEGWEREIDGLVYGIYGLSGEEIQATRP